MLRLLGMSFTFGDLRRERSNNQQEKQSISERVGEDIVDNGSSRKLHSETNSSQAMFWRFWQ